MDGTPLFHRTMDWANNDPDRGGLMRKEWAGTPWMVNVYTGSISNHGRFREIMDWCRDQFGDEASPIHGTPGNWHSGGATINGWTWMGFSTKEIHDRFCAHWTPEGE